MTYPRTCPNTIHNVSRSTCFHIWCVRGCREPRRETDGGCVFILGLIRKLHQKVELVVLLTVRPFCRSAGVAKLWSTKNVLLPGGDRSCADAESTRPAAEAEPMGVGFLKTQSNVSSHCAGDVTGEGRGGQKTGGTGGRGQISTHPNTHNTLETHTPNDALCSVLPRHLASSGSLHAHTDVCCVPGCPQEEQADRCCSHIHSGTALCDCCAVSCSRHKPGECRGWRGSTGRHKCTTISLTPSLLSAFPPPRVSLPDVVCCCPPGGAGCP